VGVSFQTVSAWEHDVYLPQLEKLESLAEVLDTTIAELCSTSPAGSFSWELRDQMFSVDHMYAFIRSFAQGSGARQTAAALPYARKMHAGQYRKGNGKVPYIYHPLLMSCHALALQLHEDDLIAALLLHDVCEDCLDGNGKRIQPEDLPVGPVARQAVRLVTKPEERHAGWEKAYYAAISGNRIATIVKVLDRCNNISLMAGGFSRQKMAQYIAETETYVMPLLDVLKRRYEESCYHAAFLVKYQMLSDMENLKRLL
ncbi:MAG: helix-turn-helix domain-containing protein, partial [Sphaerochaetaceae bacterium]|nr:helix-turn-helix domain-containing protein [Sphaerochaetaceae bacterium]